MADELKVLHEKMARDWEEMKDQLKRSDADAKAAVERANAAISATEAKLNEEKTARKELELKIARIEQLEREHGDEDESEADTKERKRFDAWCRTGCLDDSGRESKQYKALATDNDTEGGYGVPAPVRGRMTEKLIEFSPVRGLITVEAISSGNAWEAPAEGSQNFAAGKVGERDPRTETQAGKLRLERIPVHEFYANPFLTQTMVEDAGFDIEGWVARRVGTRRAVLEGGYFLNGTGEGEPEGMLTNADVAYVASGDTNEVTAEGLIDLTIALPESYARSASFMWRRATTGKIRKMRDAVSGQFLWSPGLNGATQNTVLGYGYTECIDMPLEGTDTFPVLFGDYKAAYTGVDRKGISLNRDPYSSKPFIEMYFTWRQGGQVVLAEALRKLKCATS